MSDNKLDELFNDIQNSSYYKEYKKIGKILENENEINIQINEIKELQKESSFLEANNDIRYKELDEIIKDKVEELNKNKIYQKYLEKINKLNEKLEKGNN